MSDRAWKDGRTLSVTGLAGSARSLTIAHLHGQSSGPSLAVVDGTEAAEQLRDDLISLIGESRVFLFSDWELLPYEHLSPDGEVTGSRIQTLDALVRGESVIVVAPIHGIMRRTLPKETMAGATLRLKTGDLIEFEPLLETCNSLGFERADTVQTSGQYGVRGGIIDIFPYGTTHPYRIEMFGDEVESIRLFDPYTQRSTDFVKSMAVLPSREIVLTPDSIEESALRAMEAAAPHDIDCRETVEQIQELGYFDGAERYQSFYHADAASILSYFPDNALVCLCDPGRLQEHAASFLKEIQDAYAAALKTGDIVPEPLELFADFDAWSEDLSSYHKAYLTRSAIDMTNEIDMNTSNTGSFHGAMDVVRKRLSEWRDQSAQVVIVCDNQGQADRLSDLLGEEADRISMMIGTLHAGFILPGIPLVILTDAEIFSRYQRRRRRSSFKEGVVIEDFTSLVERDFVVHIDHGIGKYMGLQRLTVDERERDCLNIVYDDGDKLYIPIEQLHRVQKYVGADGEAPTLSRLGGKAWEQAKTKTRKAVQAIAEDLVKLYAARQANPGHTFTADTPWQREMEDAFIYDETPDQLTAVDDIKQDMQRATPMDRLVCGDVGYGKTEVAIRAAFKAVQDGKQVAVLVPTTILAQQHLTTFSERLADYPLKVAMLSRFVSPKDQKTTISELENGDVDILIGTHRLLQKDILFKDLGLIVVDEEQRFGVTHKERLKRLKETVDVITMTATPIPRTLHMSLVGARDMSVINTPPRERQPVHTEVIKFEEEMIREAILREVDRGGQVYFVHNRVQSIDGMVSYLQRLLPQVTFAVGHGQMNEKNLERVMVDFMEKRYDCLVSTMIIESGLDIPNVNTIIINRADRFGLAQLYQLRGRVGRSSHRAFAYLTIPASGMVTPDARKRLAVIAEYTALGSGFHIAMRDLEIRGAGNLLGAQQHGFMAAVGFDLYCRLLQEAVQELKGEIPEEGPEPAIDLRVGAYIPDEYIADKKLKVGFYQRLSQMVREEQVDEAREEMRDRFGRLPDPTCILLDLVSIKLLARSARLRSVTVRDEGLMISYPEGRYPTKDQIGALTKSGSHHVEFPGSALFQIKVNLLDSTGVERVDLTKKMLQKLV